MPKKIFVFGSNESGIHGAGAAKTAYKEHGARWGFSYGHCGDSFAIPTKDEYFVTLPLVYIEAYVQGFLAYAHGHKKLTFQVTRIGCGLAGLNNETMAHMFYGAPPNCQFDRKWEEYFVDMSEHLGVDFNPTYWGTFQ